MYLGRPLSITDSQVSRGITRSVCFCVSHYFSTTRNTPRFEWMYIWLVWLARRKTPISLPPHSVHTHSHTHTRTHNRLFGAASIIVLFLSSFLYCIWTKQKDKAITSGSINLSQDTRPFLYHAWTNRKMKPSQNTHWSHHSSSWHHVSTFVTSHQPAYVTARTWGHCLL